VRIMWFISRWN